MSDDLHYRLKSQAALLGHEPVDDRLVARQSLNELLLASPSAPARRPTVPELAARIRKRQRYAGPSSAAMLREARDRR